MYNNFIIGAGITFLSGAAIAGANMAFESTQQHLSQNGIKMLEKLEGFSPAAYKDIAGKWTVGYGTRISDDQAAKWAPPYVMTQSEAQRLMLAHVANDRKQLDLRNLKLPQNIFDAVLITAYNIGWPAMKKSKAFAYIAMGNWAGAMSEWDWYYYHDADGNLQVSQGLKNRRAHEINLIGNGTYYV